MSPETPPGAPAVTPTASQRNRLLAALPAEAQAAIRPHLTRVHLGTGAVLYRPAAPVTHVYFPETSVASVINVLAGDGHPDDPAVEVGTVGCEGLVGLGVFLSGDEGGVAPDANRDDESPRAAHASNVPGVRAVAQVAGDAWCMPADVFAAHAGALGPLQRLLLRYTQAYLAQVTQTAACNAAHQLEARAARWLLTTRDRTDSDRLPLTHTFLAAMLGVRETGVAIALAALQAGGVIDATPHAVVIVDRPGLERAACACYGAVRAEHTRLLGSTGRRDAG